MMDSDREPPGGNRVWGSGFMPATHQGTKFLTGKKPILYLETPDGVSEQRQLGKLNFIDQLNRQHAALRPGDTELEARIASYELAYRMQSSAPEAVDITKETEATRKLYGLDNPATASYGMRCLMARRLVEKGVRFVQVTTSPGQPWDHHSKIKSDLPKIATEVVGQSNLYKWMVGGTGIEPVTPTMST